MYFLRRCLYGCLLCQKMLSKLYISKIVHLFAQFNSWLDKHKIDKQLYNHLIDMLGCNRFYFLPPPSHAIYLVSGLVHFLNDISPLINTKKGTYVTNKYYRYRQRLPSLPLNLNCYFPVPKGADDIRVVFNGTSCGLNNTVFASIFCSICPIR